MAWIRSDSTAPGPNGETDGYWNLWDGGVGVDTEDQSNWQWVGESAPAASPGTSSPTDWTPYQVAQIHANVAMKEAELAAAARAGDQTAAIKLAELEQHKYEFEQTLTRTDQNTGLDLLKLQSTLRGPSNAFQNENVLHGVNAQGLSKAVDAIAGRTGRMPSFQAPQATPEPMTLDTLIRDAQNGQGGTGTTGGTGTGQTASQAIAEARRQLSKLDPSWGNATDQQIMDKVRSDPTVFSEPGNWIRAAIIGGSPANPVATQPARPATPARAAAPKKTVAGVASGPITFNGTGSEAYNRSLMNGEHGTYDPNTQTFADAVSVKMADGSTQMAANSKIPNDPQGRTFAEYLQETENFQAAAQAARAAGTVGEQPQISNAQIAPPGSAQWQAELDAHNNWVNQVNSAEPAFTAPSAGNDSPTYNYGDLVDNEVYTGEGDTGWMPASDWFGGGDSTEPSGNTTEPDPGTDDENAATGGVIGKPTLVGDAGPEWAVPTPVGTAIVPITRPATGLMTDLHRIARGDRVPFRARFADGGIMDPTIDPTVDSGSNGPVNTYYDYKANNPQVTAGMGMDESGSGGGSGPYDVGLGPDDSGMPKAPGQTYNGRVFQPPFSLPSDGKDETLQHGDTNWQPGNVNSPSPQAQQTHDWLDQVRAIAFPRADNTIPNLGDEDLLNWLSTNDNGNWGEQARGFLPTARPVVPVSTDPLAYNKTLPDPNKILPNEWLRLPQSTRDFLISGYENKGFNGSDILDTISKLLPGRAAYSAPYAMSRR